MRRRRRRRRRWEIGISGGLPKIKKHLLLLFYFQPAQRNMRSWNTFHSGYATIFIFTCDVPKHFIFSKHFFKRLKNAVKSKIFYGNA